MYVFQNKINGTQWEKRGKGNIKAGKGNETAMNSPIDSLKKTLLVSEVEFLLYLILFPVIDRVAHKV